MNNLYIPVSIYILFAVFGSQLQSYLTRNITINNPHLRIDFILWLQDTECDIQGLVENREYEFRVAACNDNGLSEYLQAENPIVAKLPFGKLCFCFFVAEYFAFTRALQDNWFC